MAKPGPRPKGARAAATIRCPTDHIAIYRSKAQREGLPLSDYLARELARHHDLPDPGYLDRPAGGQQQLPVSA